jgi:large subunit ribosomal protein L23
VSSTPDQILKRLILTEKTAFLAEASNVYTFEVPLSATKPQVRDAVEGAFSVRVVKVNSITRQSRSKRYRAHVGMTAEKKRVLVKLHSEDRISLY